MRTTSGARSRWCVFALGSLLVLRGVTGCGEDETTQTWKANAVDLPPDDAWPFCSSRQARTLLVRTPTVVAISAHSYTYESRCEMPSTDYGCGRQCSEVNSGAWGPSRIVSAPGPAALTASCEPDCEAVVVPQGVRVSKASPGIATLLLIASSPNVAPTSSTVRVEFVNDLTCPPDLDASVDAGIEAALDGG